MAFRAHHESRAWNPEEHHIWRVMDAAESSGNPLADIVHQPDFRWVEMTPAPSYPGEQPDTVRVTRENGVDRFTRVRDGFSVIRPHPRQVADLNIVRAQMQVAPGPMDCAGYSNLFIKQAMRIPEMRPVPLAGQLLASLVYEKVTPVPNLTWLSFMAVYYNIALSLLERHFSARWMNEKEQASKRPTLGDAVIGMAGMDIGLKSVSLVWSKPPGDDTGRFLELRKIALLQYAPDEWSDELFERIVKRHRATTEHLQQDRLRKMAEAAHAVMHLWP